MRKIQEASSGSSDVSGVHLWLILMKAFPAMADCGARDLRGGGLGDSDFRIMEALLHKGPLPVNTIGPKVFLTPGSISIAVDRLHKRGLVSRVDSETDRRVRVVDLTADGRALICKIFGAHAQHMEELAEVLTASERMKVAEALKKLGKRAAECEKP
jgi:MarR family 2-MHQ and catechol resistance regulon transcriptional repressor